MIFFSIGIVTDWSLLYLQNACQMVHGHRHALILFNIGISAIQTYPRDMPTVEAGWGLFCQDVGAVGGKGARKAAFLHLELLAVDLVAVCAVGQAGG